MPARPTVLMVSKPVVPPWNDSGKNLVKDLVSHGRRFRYRVLTTHGYTLPGEHVVCEPLYGGAGAYSPSLKANARVFARLLGYDGEGVRHFFFAPNAATSRAARITQLVRRVPTVQTVSSAPREGDAIAPLLFADRVVVLSEWSRRRVIGSGVDAARVVRIAPCIEVPDVPDGEARARARARYGLDGEVVLYAGDYQFSHAARTLASAIPRIVLARPEARFVFACRIKQPASRDEEAVIRAQLAAAGVGGRARFLNEVSDILDLVSAADVIALPAESTYAKMDLPLVLLEAMARGVPVVVADAGPLTELTFGDAAIAVAPGDPAALAAALVALLADPAGRRALGERGRSACRERYDAPLASRRHEELYSELLERCCIDGGRLSAAGGWR